MEITQTEIAEMNHRSLDVVDGAIIHHSVFDKTADISVISAFEQRPPLSAIAVGYHAYVKCVDVEKDEWVVQMGRPINCVPAAALGYNTRSIDICIGGNYEVGGAPFLDSVSPNALKAAAGWINEAKKKCPNLKYLDGHRDVARWTEILAAEGLTPSNVSTACPGSLLYARLHDLRVLTGLHARVQ